MSTSPETNNNRYTRYSGIITPETLQSTHACVVGVGAIGSQVARLLVSIGIGTLTIIDHDTVSALNLGPQGFAPSDVGTAKVFALRETIECMNPDMPFNALERKARRSDFTSPNVIFMCVDTMEAREQLTKGLEAPKILIDTRMGAHSLRVITANSIPTYAAYEATLFPDAEALQEPCTTRSTCYAAYVAAGIAVSSMVQALRSFPVPPDVTFNLLSYDSYLTTPTPAAVPALL
jgi:molybdopterin/thiamine biosynthesis adenylyltransferase